MRSPALSLAAIGILSSCSGISREVPRGQPVLARPALAQDAATIAALEDRWAQAFLSKDLAFLDAIVAPEFKLIGWANDKLNSVPRDRWMANAKKWDFRRYQIDLLDVVVVGDTAVAAVRGSWIVHDGGREIINNRFFLTDTWVRRNGRWQVVMRSAATIK